MGLLAQAPPHERELLAALNKLAEKNYSQIWVRVCRVFAAPPPPAPPPAASSSTQPPAAEHAEAMADTLADTRGGGAPQLAEQSVQAVLDKCLQDRGFAPLYVRLLRDLCAFAPDVPSALARAIAPLHEQVRAEVQAMARASCESDRSPQTGQSQASYDLFCAATRARKRLVNKHLMLLLLLQPPRLPMASDHSADRHAAWLLQAVRDAVDVLLRELGGDGSGVAAHDAHDAHDAQHAQHSMHAWLDMAHDALTTRVMAPPFSSRMRSTLVMLVSPLASAAGQHVDMPVRVRFHAMDVIQACV